MAEITSLMGLVERIIERDEWWVLDVDGHPLGRLLTPPGLRVLYITGDDVWGVETDEFDVNYIVKYTINRPNE